MNTSVNVRSPLFADAIGGKTPYEWLKRNNAVEKIIKNGFAELPIDPDFLGHHAPSIYRGLDVIVENPDTFVINAPRNDELREDMESGLMKRLDDELKWQFHAFRGIESVLRSQGTPVEHLREFFGSSYELDRAAFDISCALATLFDEFNRGQPNGYSGQMAMSVADGKSVIRFLKYLLRQTTTDDPDAKVHTDRGWNTVHWVSTKTGLIVYDNGGNAQRVHDTDPRTVLIFPGRKFGTLTDGRWGFGTVHGVRDEGRSTRAQELRRAIVSFVHARLDEEQCRKHLAYIHAGRFKPDSERFAI